MRYIKSEHDKPQNTDYYFEATQVTQDHFPSIPIHSHNFYEIYIHLKGAVKLAIDDKIYKVNYGDIVLIPPFTVHQLLPDEGTKDCKRIYMYISEACIASFNFMETSLIKPILMATENKQHFFHTTDEDFSKIYEAMFMIFRSRKTEYYGKEMLNHARIIEIITLLNKYIEQENETEKTEYAPALIDQVSAYINKHYQLPLTLDSLAETFFINKYTLSRKFKSQMMVTIHEYLILKRINTAKLKIIEGASPSNVYLDVGFTNYSTFYRAFKSYEKISPQEFAEFSKI